MTKKTWLMEFRGVMSGVGRIDTGPGASGNGVEFDCVDANDDEAGALQITGIDKTDARNLAPMYGKRVLVTITVAEVE